MTAAEGDRRPWWIAVVVVWAGLVLGAGGFAEGVLAPAMLAMGALAVVLAAAMHGRWRPADLGWVWLVPVPAAVLATVTVLPLGIGHPWTAVDRALLGTAPEAYAIDADRARVATAWAWAVAALALAATVAARGGRGRILAAVLVAAGAVHGASALVTASLVPDWPGESYAGRVRGAFVYPNHAAAAWASLIPLALAMASGSVGRRRWWWAAAVVLAVATVLTASRGGTLIALAATVPWWWSALPRRGRLPVAVAGVAAIVGLLALLNLDQVDRRFTGWDRPVETLSSGRTAIWSAAVPVAADAGPLGSGPGTALPAFRRAGLPELDGRVVDHLHSDPLQWWLERGWVGVLALGAGLVLVARRWSRAWSDDPGRRGLAAGALGGIAVLAAHGCLDLIWQSPALVVQGVLLAAVAAGTLGSAAAPVPSWPVRAGLAGVGAAALALGLWAWPVQGELERAAAVQRVVASREAAGADPLLHPLVRRVAAEPAATGELARVRAAVHAARDGRGGTAAALVAESLQVVARRQPGSAGAWLERLRSIAAGADPGPGAEPVLERLAVWAPAWAPAVDATARLVAGGGLPATRAQEVAGRLLDGRVPVPAWFLDEAAKRIGDAAVVRSLAREGSASARIGVPWLARRGPVEVWLAVRRRVDPGPWAVAPAAAGLGAELAHPLTMIWPRAGDDAAGWTLALARAGIAVPGADRDLSVSAGALVSDAAERDRLRASAAVRLHRPDGRWLDARVAAAAAIAAGRSPAAGTDADLLAESADALTRLQPFRGWSWTDLPGGGRWSWRFVVAGERRPVTAGRWTAVLVDGTFHHWFRGRGDPVEGVAPGLRRVVLVEP
jgi:hypothetical protein